MSEPLLCHGCGMAMGQWAVNTWGCQSCGRRVTFPTDQADAPKTDPVNPQHYVKGGIEVRHVIRAFECTYNTGTAIAYLLRAKFKANYLEDIKKAIQHLQFEVEDKEKAK